MARLHEYQGKALLKKHQIAVPEGRLAASAEEARQAARELGRQVVVKAQIWATGRAGIGGIQFADSPEEALLTTRMILSLKSQNFPVERVLVEERLEIDREFYSGLIIDDQVGQPMILFSSAGGTGIEEIARQHPEKLAQTHVDIIEGFKNYEARNLVRKTGIHGRLQLQVADVLLKLYRAARSVEARAAEINPLVVTTDGRLVAVDCRFAVDDYAVFRHPELGIEIARELNRPPTKLDKIAYEVERNDYRGTFYFIQMDRGFESGQGYVGFHGAGGGGSMMSMDAVTRQGFKVANFCDTSGNPPASKVYRAAKIILSQPNIDAYFGSGSGVASQEQYHQARGLVKAFREENLSIPAVIRLGGNGEDLAVEILEEYTQDLPAPVKGFKKDDSADFCAQYLRKVVDDYNSRATQQSTEPIPVPAPSPAGKPYRFEIRTGQITFDHTLCARCVTQICVKACAPQILKLENELPVLAITREEAKRGGCIECLACEVECWFHGNNGAQIDLPIEGLDAYRRVKGLEMLDEGSGE